jgi:hypothetical protein
MRLQPGRLKRKAMESQWWPTSCCSKTETQCWWILNSSKLNLKEIIEENCN